MKKILNLTQHVATPSQIAAGVIEPKNKEVVKLLLDFNEIPTLNYIWDKANALTDIAIKSHCKSAMIGGAPYLMGPLEDLLKRCGITPLYSFTKRETVEEPDGNGGVKKTSVFNHVGWVKTE